MSQEVVALSKTKGKKAQRDAERRKGTGSKRKHDDGNLQPQDDLEKDFIPLDGGDDYESKHGQAREGTSAKRKAGAIEAQDVEKTPKKRRKVKSQPAENADEVPGEKTTKPRFIVFVGNLPYSTTDASLKSHFRKLQPFNLRHRTDPKTKKSKGFAFLEFENYDRMKTCLKLYHHSMFDPSAPDREVDVKGVEDAENEKPAKNNKEARRINVELTAGGGGKAAGRKEKIKTKNSRLEEQRKRRAEAEKTERGKTEKKKTTKADAVPSVDKQAKAVADGDAMAGVHPSRLARIQR